MPDVRMPDGTVIRNVPEGTTRAQLMARMSKAQPKAQPRAKSTGSGMLDQAISSVNEFLIGVPQGLYNAASAVTDPIASLIVGDDAVKQARGQRQRVVDSASRALVSRPSSAARTAGQVGGAMLIPGPKPVAALGKAGPAVSRAIQGAVGGAAVRDSDTSGLPEAGIGAVANVVLPPIIGKIASTKPVQAVGKGLANLLEPVASPIVSRLDDASEAILSRVAPRLGFEDAIPRNLPIPNFPPSAAASGASASGAAASATGGPSVNFGFSIPKPAPAQPLIPPPRAPNNLSPLGRDAALREGRFRSLGVEQPTTGMVTRDPRAWNFERETAKRYGAGDELIGQFQNVEKQLVDAGNKLVRSQGGAKGPEATGLAVQKALDAKRKEMQEATGALYKQVRDTRGDVPAGPLNSFREVLDSPAVMDNPIFDQMREGVMRRLQRFGMAGQSGLLRNDAVATVSQAEELRKLIGGLGASNDPTVRAGRRMMIDALDDDVVNTLGDDAFKAARQSAKARFDEFSKTFAGRIADEGIPPERLTQRLFGATSLKDLRSLKQSLTSGTPEQIARGQTAMKGLRSQALDDLMSGSVSPDGKLNGTALFRGFEKNAAKLREILDPADYKTLRRLVLASRDATAEVPFSAVNNSNTAASAANLFRDLKAPEQQGWLKFLAKHGAAFMAGGPGANVGLAVGESALSHRAAQKTASELARQVQIARSPQEAAKALSAMQRAAQSNAEVAAILKRWQDLTGNNPIIGGLAAGATKE